MLKVLWIMLAVFTATNAVAESSPFIVGKDELGETFNLDTDNWPVQYTCSNSRKKSQKTWFEIRVSQDLQIPDNAWLILNDDTGYKGKFYRNGLGWRFDWNSRTSSARYSLNIVGGRGYYYDWSLMDKANGGRVTRIYCK